MNPDVTRATQDEDALEPALPIVDAHHHLRDRPGDSYLFDDLRRDLCAGHDVRASVAIECGDMYRSFGAEAFRPVGEAEFLTGVAAMFASGRYGARLACAAIVAFADLRLDNVWEVLDALTSACGGRLRGIRNPVAWDPAPALTQTRSGPEGILHDARFARGVSLLGTRGLSLDAWVYHPQLSDLATLARRCPQTTIVLNHLGGPLGTGPYAGRRDEVFAQWRDDLSSLAQCLNVVCKLGGLGMPILGFPLRPEDPSIAYADAWKPYIETAIAAFGIDRCMFESNTPSDRGGGYVKTWNAFKRITSGYSAAERRALFSGTAMRVYRLEQSFAEAGEPLASVLR